MGNFTNICPDIRNLTSRPRDNLTFKKELERQCHVQMQIKEEAYKLRQKEREADSPEFISPHSTTDTMDTDEAQVEDLCQTM